MFDNYGTYNHIGDNVAGDKIVNQGATQEDWKSFMACVKVETPGKQHNRPGGTACCSASNGMIPHN